MLGPDACLIGPIGQLNIKPGYLKTIPLQFKCFLKKFFFLYKMVRLKICVKSE